MKNKLIYVTMLILTAINFTACNNDDSPMIAPQELNKDFGTDETKMSVTYSDAPLIGKTAKFHTDDSQTATITLMDIIPGETQTLIDNIQLVETSDRYTFSGSTTSNSSTKASITYSGSVNSNELNIALNVTMPQSKWTQNYTLSELTIGDEQFWVYSRKGLRPPYTYTYKEMTRTNTVITSAGYVAIKHFLPGANTTPQDTIDACNITTFTDKFRSALGCVLPQVIQTISLEKDGNVTAKYSSETIKFDQSYLINPQEINSETVAGLTNGRTWLQSPKNLAYWFEKDGNIYIKLNISAIISQSMSGENANSNAIAGLISNILNGDPASIKQMLSALDMDITKALAKMSDATFSTVLNWIKNGIPVKSNIENGHTYIYIDQEILNPILAEVPALLPVIEELIPEESRSLTMSTINNILKGYQYTSEFKIGLDLTAQ